MYLLGRFFDLALRLRLVHNAKFLMKTPKVFRNSLAQRVHIISNAPTFFDEARAEIYHSFVISNTQRMPSWPLF